MAISYHDPATVTNPQTFVRSVEVLYDGGAEGFSLAMIDWEGLDHIGIRWNVARKELDDAGKQAGRAKCDGAPATKGVPSWFLLPRELFNPVLFDKESERFLEMVKGWDIAVQQ